jgi:hypothetical protein
MHRTVLLTFLAAATGASAAIVPATYNFATNPYTSLGVGGGRTQFAHSTDLGFDAVAGRLDGLATNTQYGFAANASIGSFGVGDVFIASVQLLSSNGNVLPSGANLASLVVGNSLAALNTTDNTNFEFTLRADGAFGTGSAGLRLRSHDGSTRTTQLSASVFTDSTFSENTWHDFSVRLTRTSGSSFSYVATLTNLATSAVILSESNTITNASVAGASDLYAGFVTYVSSAGLGTNSLFSSADNFRAIPEPSTYAAIAGVLALGWAAWRRRR